jgi:hypothetical protein
VKVGSKAATKSKEKTASVTSSSGEDIPQPWPYFQQDSLGSIPEAGYSLGETSKSTKKIPLHSRSRSLSHLYETEVPY